MEPRARQLLETIQASMEKDGGNSLGLALAVLKEQWDKEDSDQSGPE